MLNIKNISKYLVVSLKMRNFALAFEGKKVWRDSSVG
jgi:hypothetical protein